MLPVIVFHSVRRHSIRCIRGTKVATPHSVWDTSSWLLLKLLPCSCHRNLFQVNGRLIQHHTGVRMPCQLIQHELWQLCTPKSRPVFLPHGQAYISSRACIVPCHSFLYSIYCISMRAASSASSLSVRMFTQTSVSGAWEETCMSLLLPECPDAGPDGWSRRNLFILSYDTTFSFTSMSAFSTVQGFHAPGCILADCGTKKRP